MKFGKDKDSQQDPGSKKTKAKSSVPLRSPSLFVGLAGLAAALVTAGILFLQHFLINQPYHSALSDEVNQAQLDAINLVFSEKLLNIQNQAVYFSQGLAPEVFQGALEVREHQAAVAVRSIPGALRVLVSQKGRATRDNQAPLPISFASLDLIRKVEQSQEVRLEAFAVQQTWYVQVVVPKLDRSGNILGTVLIMYGAEVLKPDWKKMPTGGVQLLQQVEGDALTVLQHGSLSDDVVQLQTALPQWTVAYSRGQDLQTESSLMLMLVLAVVGAVICAGAVAAVVIVLLQKIRKDAGMVANYTKNILQGDKAPQPKIQLSLLHTMVVVIAQSAKSLSSKKSKSAKPTTGASPKAPAKPPVKPKVEPAPAPDFSEDAEIFPEADGELEEAEPLFQGDSLDIDMLGDDDDLLGLNDEDLGLDQGVVGDMDLDEGGAVEMPEEIFRAYDIRGIVGETMSSAIMRAIGRALGSEVIHRGGATIAVGMDGRNSSPELTQALTQGLLSTGVSVVDTGRVPTPVLYFAVEHLQLDAGAIVTGSHNPANYNGLKMVIKGQSLVQEDMEKLLARIQSENFASAKGELSAADVRADYVDRIISDIAVAAPLKVVVDAGNGVAGEIAPQLLTELGCEVTALHCEVDGSFPNHHPDPSKPENLQDLIEKVKAEDADVGIALDGDGDRIGVVANTGQIIWPDQLLMLFAKDVVSRNPGADVIFDVKCSRRLNALISSYGGRPVMWRTGHSLIKAKMRETGALLAGEMSGHIFFKERWFGFDDALYSAARLLEVLGIEDRDSQSVFDDFPVDLSTPELQVAVTEESKFQIVEQLAKHGNWGDATLSTIDGIRADYADGWGLCRASNTTPNLVLRFEAETEEALERIKTIFKNQLQALDNAMQLPF